MFWGHAYHAPLKCDILSSNKDHLREQLMPNTDTRAANTESVYHVHKKDLPLACPMPDMPVWNSHPRVYLPIADSGEETCPYCGARFVLVDHENQKAAE